MADFADPAIRAAVAATGWMPREAPPMIAGRPCVPPAWLPITSPSHRHLGLGRAGASDAGLAQQAMDVAALAFPGWRDTPMAARAAILERAADLLLVRRWDFAADLVHEAGKSWRDADAEVAEAVDFLRYYAAGARDLARGGAVDLPGETNDTVWEPRGPTVVIAPWNFPLAILGGMAAAALAVGCPVILKPAEQAPLVAFRFHALLLEAGIPPAVCAYLPGRGEKVGPALLAHPELAVVAFTGSRPVGELIRQAAAAPGHRHLVQVVAELGGKNAILVDASADLDEAVAGIVASAMGYQGQKCSACSRVIVHQDLHAPLRERLIAALTALPVGPAEDLAHGLGPVIDGEAHVRLTEFLARQGTPTWAGTIPSALAGEGWYLAPHLFDGVDPDGPLAQDELFGPILALMPARDLEHALALANGTRYALTGGCYARTPSVLERVRRDFRVGNLYLNRGITGALVHRQPFGGGRLSGVGSKAGGPDYLRWFCWARIVTENTLRHGMVGGRSQPRITSFPG